jgi:hypothetical protein
MPKNERAMNAANHLETNEEAEAAAKPGARDPRNLV